MRPIPDSSNKPSLRGTHGYRARRLVSIKSVGDEHEEDSITRGTVDNRLVIERAMTKAKNQ